MLLLVAAMAVLAAVVMALRGVSLLTAAAPRGMASRHVVPYVVVAARGLVVVCGPTLARLSRWDVRLGLAGPGSVADSVSGRGVLVTP